jgi:hypothetical protein
VRRVLPFPHHVYRLIYVLRRLGILSQTEDSLWIRFSAFFRVDPCLRLLEGLEEDLRQKVQRMTVCSFALKLKSTSYTPQEEVRLRVILSANNARQTDVALPTAEMSNPQACEADATHAESMSLAFSSDCSTAIESMGSRTSKCLHRATTPSTRTEGQGLDTA